MDISDLTLSKRWVQDAQREKKDLAHAVERKRVEDLKKNKQMNEREKERHKKKKRCSQAEVKVAVGGSAESTWIKNPSKPAREKKRMKKGVGDGGGGALSASELQPMQWEMGQAGTERRCYCHSRCLPGPCVPPTTGKWHALLQLQLLEHTHTHRPTPGQCIGAYAHTHIWIYTCLSKYHDWLRQLCLTLQLKPKWI